jgi:tetratricopeptide (TPR) repeat protein
VEEAQFLERDAKLLPDNAPIHYRLGLLQYLLGREEQAEASLARACELQPNAPDFLMALTLLYEKQQRWELAIGSAKKLNRLEPENETYQQILRDIEQAAAQSRGR